MVQTPLVVGILGLVLLISVPPAAAQDPWTTLETDDPDDARCAGARGSCAEFTNPYIDLASIQAKQDADDLYVRFNIFPPEGALSLYEDDVYYANVEISVGNVVLTVRAEVGKATVVEVSGERDTWLPLERRPYTGSYAVTGAIHALTIRLGKADLASLLQWPANPVLNVGSVQLGATDKQMGEAYDMAYASYARFPVSLPARPPVSLSTSAWKQLVGPGHATAPSLDVDISGGIHAAFIVYEGTGRGLYYATMRGPSLAPEFLTDVEFPKLDPRTSHPAFNTTTAIAVGDHVYIVFFPRPGQGGGIRLAESGPEGWKISDPARLANGTSLVVDDSYGAIAAVGASRDRLLVAVPTRDPDGFVIVERKGQSWTAYEPFAGRTLPRLEVDDRNCAQLASFEKDEYPDSPQDTDGAVFLASNCPEDEGYWHDWPALDNVQDLSAQTGSSAQDGSFDIAASAGGSAWLAFETTSGARRLAHLKHFTDLEPLRATVEPSGLRPASDEPQGRIRVAVHAGGTVHTMSGNDQSELYAVRKTDGASTVQSAQGFGMFQLDVTRDGYPLVAAVELSGNHSFVLATSLANPASFVDSDEPVGLPDVEEVEPVVDAPTSSSMPPGIPSTQAWENIAVLGTMMSLGLGGLAAKRAAYRTPRWFLSAFAAVGGFSRLNKDKLLEHQVREVIVEAVRAEPGSPASEVRHELDLAKTTFFYHLSRLTKDGLVRLQRANHVLLLYPGGGALPPAPAALLDADARLLSLMRRMPPATAIEYARQLSAEPRTVRLRLQRLARSGAVESTRENARDVRWAPAQRQP